jgi:putative transposase
MKFYQGKIYHVYNRGNNRQNIFFERENYLFFLKKMRKHLTRHCDVLAWCLMPNHFHWMIQVHQDYETNTTGMESDFNFPIVEPLNRSISTLLSSYTKAMNRKYNRTGSLFQGRTKSKDLSPNEELDDQYPLICFCYIHQNPFKAKLVHKLEDWEFSSFRDYAGLRSGTFCNKKKAIELLELPVNAQKFKKLSYQTIPESLLENFF